MISFRQRLPILTTTMMTRDGLRLETEISIFLMGPEILIWLHRPPSLLEASLLSGLRWVNP